VTLGYATTVTALQALGMSQENVEQE
jgi:hypothetical protein